MAAITKPSEMLREALISDCGLYRYWLARWWADGPRLSFIMLNPSKADALIDDPTIKKCVGFAMRWGFGSIIVRNLFAYRATKPKELRRVDSPIGKLNDEELMKCRAENMNIAAWGASVPFRRVDDVERLLQGVPLWCLKKTKDGSPWHPLYVPYDKEREPFWGV